MKLFKKVLFCLIASSVFSVIWLLLLNAFEPLRDKNYEFGTFAVFIAASVGIALFTTREYLKQKDKKIVKRVGCVALTAAMSFAVIAGMFYLAIIALLYHVYP